MFLQQQKNSNEKFNVDFFEAMANKAKINNDQNDSVYSLNNIS